LKIPQISIVAPLYNEAETFPLLVERINALMDSSPLSIEVVLIDDGSKDDTAMRIRQLALTDDRYHGVLLSRNHGHQLALTAGMARARGSEAIFVIDGDLQDPPELLPEFYKLYKEGNDVVYAVRKKRKEGVVKKTGYYLFYRLLRSISYVEIPLDSGDFALISRRVVDVMNKMPEESRYLRGMRSWIGFKQTGFEYERDARAAGESKYSFKQLFALAYNGIFNFSEFPIKFMSRTGIMAMLIALILFSGVQLLALGIIGEYVLRIFFQAKERPLYIVKDEIVNCEYI
jgi:glycosyltransferase involved in cell wall biosynthesis